MSYRLHHHRQGTLPHVLHVRAGVPRQGDSHHRRPGPGDRRALHRLRQLRAASARSTPSCCGARSTRCAALLRSGASGGGLPGPQLSRRVHRHRLPAARRHAPRLGFRPGGRGVLRRRPGGPPSTGSCCRQRNGHRYISTTCPAIVGYVERYYPDLVGSLAPIVSPMIAMARAVRATARRRSEDRVHRPVHRQEGRGAERRGGRRGRRGAHVPRTAAHVRRRRASCPRRSSRAISIRRTAPPAALFPISRGMLAGRRPPRGPDDRRGRRHARPQPHARGDQGVRRRRPGRQAAGSALLRRLHHGPGHEQRPAAVQSPPPRAHATSADRMQDARPRAVANATWSGSPTSICAATFHANDQRIPLPAQSELDGHHAPHGQVRARRRAELRRLRLRHLPRARHGHLQGAGRERDVPAEHDRPAPQGPDRKSRRRTSSWPRPRKRSCSRRSWPAWANWRPASPTR